MTSDAVSDDRLNEMLAGLEGVTPGEWKPWKSPEGNDVWMVRAAYLDDHDRRCTAWPAACSAGGQDNEINARHIARLDPATVRSILTELLALRTSKAGDVVAYGPELWGRQPDTRVWVQIANGSNTHEQVVSFKACYKKAGWTNLRYTNPFNASTAPAAMAVTDAMIERAWHTLLGCPHTITHGEVILRHDPSRPGIAAAQLHGRLRAALTAALA